MCKVSPQKNGDEDTDMEDARTAAPAKESRELVKSVTVVGRPVAGTGKRASMLKDLLVRISFPACYCSVDQANMVN